MLKISGLKTDPCLRSFYFSMRQNKPVMRYDHFYNHKNNNLFNNWSAATQNIEMGYSVTRMMVIHVIKRVIKRVNF